MRETRGKTVKEHRKNNETRRICSVIISRQIRQIRHLKKEKRRERIGQIGHLKKRE
jgi:hypothetical protein